MDDIQQTPLTTNGSDLLLAAYPDLFRKANPENNTNILMLIIVIIFEFLMIFGLYSMKKKKKSRRDDQLLSTILDDFNDIQQHRPHPLLDASHDVQQQQQRQNA